MRRFVLAFVPLMGILGGMICAASRAAAETVDFEDLIPTMPYDGPGGGYYWNGPAANGHDELDPWTADGTLRHVGTFSSDGLAFVNRFNATWGNWSGFAYSNACDTTTAGYTNQFSACTGSGFGPGDDNYAVAYGYDDSLVPTDAEALRQLPYFQLPDGARIQSAYVANTTYAVLSMLHGDSFARKFGCIWNAQTKTWDDVNYPDWLQLPVYGTDVGGVPLASSVRLYLADYRNEGGAADYILTEWPLLDLSPLADAIRLYFNLTSSDVGEWGMNTPAYFALDNIRYSFVPEPSAAILLGGAAAAGIFGWKRRVRKESRTTRPAPELGTAA